MSRALPAECNTPEWNKRMHDFTVNYARGQAMRAIKEHYITLLPDGTSVIYGKAFSSDFDIIRARFEWKPDFIYAVLAAMGRPVGEPVV